MKPLSDTCRRILQAGPIPRELSDQDYDTLRANKKAYRPTLAEMKADADAPDPERGQLKVLIEFNKLLRERRATEPAEPKAVAGANANALLLDLINKHPECQDWTSRKLGIRINRSKSSVEATVTWKAIMEEREKRKRQRMPPKIGQRRNQKRLE